MRREAYIKSLRKAQKLDLLASNDWKEKLDQWGLEELL
jgi:predicted GIY-YIG superfamily endonuclease